MANNDEIISGVDFNCDDDIIFTKPKQNASGGKSVGILNSKSKKSLYMSTPLMLTWGINEYSDEKSGRVTYDMNLQFPSSEYNTPEIKKFLQNMQKFEEKVKQEAITNCKEWMNKPKMSKEVIEALWTPMLRYPKCKETGDFDYSRSPTLRMKLPFWEGVFKNIEIYDIKHTLLFPNGDNDVVSELITKGSNVATIIQSGGVWFANGKFGVTWKLFQCLVKPKQTLSGKCHIALSESDKSKMVVDSDEEEEEEEEVEAKVEVKVEAEAEVEAEVEAEAEAEAEAEVEVEQEVEQEVKSVKSDDVVKKKKLVSKKKKAPVATAD